MTIEGRLVPAGVLEVKTRVVGATDFIYEQKVEKVHERVEWSNARTNREQFFFNDDVVRLTLIENGKAKAIESLPEKLEEIRALSKDEKAHRYLIAVKSLTSAWSPAGMMMVACRVDEMYRDRIGARLIYDYPNYVQDEYWEQATGVIRKFIDMKKDGHPLVSDFSDQTIPIIMGSHSRKVNVKDGNPSNRTVLFHHDHLMFVDYSHMG